MEREQKNKWFSAEKIGEKLLVQTIDTNMDGKKNYITKITAVN